MGELWSATAASASMSSASPGNSFLPSLVPNSALRNQKRAQLFETLRKSAHLRAVSMNNGLKSNSTSTTAHDSLLQDSEFLQSLQLLTHVDFGMSKDSAEHHSPMSSSTRTSWNTDGEGIRSSPSPKPGLALSTSTMFSGWGGVSPTELLETMDSTHDSMSIQSMKSAISLHMDHVGGPTPPTPTPSQQPSTQNPNPIPPSSSFNPNRHGISSSLPRPQLQALTKFSSSTATPPGNGGDGSTTLRMHSKEDFDSSVEASRSSTGLTSSLSISEAAANLSKILPSKPKSSKPIDALVSPRRVTVKSSGQS